MSIAPGLTEVFARCASTLFWEQGMCGQFCAAMYGYGFSGYRDAVAQWEAVPRELKVPGGSDAPPGTLLFWSGGSQGHGHVAIAEGTGYCWSIDIGGPGTVSRVQVGTISQRWGLPYLGWSVPYFQGMQWSVPMIKGVDVSNYQAVSGWETGIDFAFVKVTEGTGYVNPRWVQQRDTARAAGLVLGYYHFARPGDMVTQADHFLKQFTLLPGDVLMFDWEDRGVTSAQKDAWISYVQSRTGHRVLLYCNTDFWKNLDRTSFAGDGLWIATGGYLAGQPPIQSAWLIHQYSTAGNLDHDVAQFKTRADMAAWAGGDDVPLTDADVNKIAAALVPKVADAVFAKMFKTDDVLSAPPDASDIKTNPYWTFQTHVQAQTSTVRAVQDDVAKALELLGGALAQARSNGSGLSEIKTLLTGLDLSGLPAAVTDKLTKLKIVLEEQT